MTKTDKPMLKCMYCGEEMLLVDYYGEFSYCCTNEDCKACSPIADNPEEAYSKAMREE